MVVKTAYKVRLEDGMEVGPLDGEMLRSWYQQGMIKAQTKIRQPAIYEVSRLRLGPTHQLADLGRAVPCEIHPDYWPSRRGDGLQCFLYPLA